MSACAKCGRTISEHWDFPKVCDGFNLPAGAIERETLENKLKWLCHYDELWPLIEDYVNALTPDRKDHP